MVYNPFPLSSEPIFRLHVLVTEPNKPQRHLVIGELASGAAAAVIEKDETLKPGKVFRLDDSQSGRVVAVTRPLVPRVLQPSDAVRGSCEVKES